MDSALTAIAAIGSVGIIICLLVWYVLQFVAMWAIFKKAGVAGWKSLIPWYREYCMFRIAWKSKASAWVYLICSVISGVYTTYQGSLQIQGNAGNTNLGISILQLVSIILWIAKNFKMAKAFRKGAGYGFGLTLLAPIFNLILGFGSAQYDEPQD